MFKRILIVYKNNISEKGLEVLQKVRDMVEGEVRFVSGSNVSKTDVKEADLVITLGGDGTFLSAGNLIEDSLILGINLDPNLSEGFLTSINANELDCLREILSGKFGIVCRHRAHIVLNGKILDEHALNEVYVGADKHFHTSRYVINFKGIKEEHRSAGIIISTGTGSTAWFKSAGGKPFNHDEKKLKFIVREPYTGSRVFIPTILNGEIGEEEKLILKSTKYSGGIISIGYSCYGFNKGDIVEIKLSGRPLRVIVKGEDTNKLKNIGVL